MSNTLLGKHMTMLKADYVGKTLLTLACTEFVASWKEVFL